MGQKTSATVDGENVLPDPTSLLGDRTVQMGLCVHITRQGHPCRMQIQVCANGRARAACPHTAYVCPRKLQSHCYHICPHRHYVPVACSQVLCIRAHRRLRSPDHGPYSRRRSSPNQPASSRQVGSVRVRQIGLLLTLPTSCSRRGSSPLQRVGVESLGQVGSVRVRRMGLSPAGTRRRAAASSAGHALMTRSRSSAFCFRSCSTCASSQEGLALAHAQAVEAASDGSASQWSRGTAMAPEVCSWGFQQQPAGDAHMTM